MTQQNAVTVFSNGIADFRRIVNLTHDNLTKVDIPVQQNHIADVLSSLTVQGSGVKIANPARYRPANEKEGAFELDPKNVLTSMIQTLSGARVKLRSSVGVDETKTGILVGMHLEDVLPLIKDQSSSRVSCVVILTSNGLEKIRIDNLLSLEFLEDAVRAEVDKALQRNFQKIKPNSTFVTLELTTKEESAQAAVCYSIPAAAWKISYRLRDGDKGFDFQGFAVVDNNTDEDWNDVIISVVTGEPITFSTDLADAKIPRRQHVNIVKDAAIGAVEIESVYSKKIRSMTRGAAEGSMMACAAGTTVMGFDDSQDEYAQINKVDVQEVDDFAIFTSKDTLSIPSKRSALIPMFQHTTKSAKSVLHFKESNNPERAFRAIKFKNDVGHSLGRGPCTVYQNGVNAGQCVFPGAKPDEECLLPHYLETGVRFKVTFKQDFQEISIKVQDGAVTHITKATNVSTYKITNNVNDDFELFLDHELRLLPSNGKDVKVAVQSDSTEIKHNELKNGRRVIAKVAGYKTVVIEVLESRIDSQTLSLKNGNFHPLLNIDANIIENNESLKKCLALSVKKDNLEKDRHTIENKIRTLGSRRIHLREDMKAFPKENQQESSKALSDVALEIKKLEDIELPELELKFKSASEELQKALKSASAEWNK